MFQVKDLDLNEDDDIDIVTAEGDSVFSDSDMSQEEVRFLPPDPCPDVPGIEDGLVVSTPKEGEISETGSPLSEEAGQNGHLRNHESSPLEGMILGFSLILLKCEFCCHQGHY